MLSQLPDAQSSSQMYSVVMEARSRVQRIITKLLDSYNGLEIAA